MQSNLAQSPLERVEAALRDIQLGKMIILTDDPERENEGDLVIAAEKVTPEAMNFIIRHTSGIVCLSLPQAQCEKLALPFMVAPTDNSSLRGTPFTISIDAKHPHATGVSAADRVRTVQAAIAADAVPDDLVKPGHIFPLQAKAGGVLERAGHTEGAIDLVRLANLKPAAVLCELMNLDGTMMRGAELNNFARQHKLALVSIADLIEYRYHYENLLAVTVTANLPLAGCEGLQVMAVREELTGGEHLVLMNLVNAEQPVLARIHSSCLTGDLFGSLRCDCNKQLHYSLERIKQEGGVLIYLQQEGRGIGLFNKIKAYALQDGGLDTIEANEKLGLPIDSRQYHIAANVLRNLGLRRVRLLTNNMNKVAELKKFGIDVVGREVMPVFCNQHNKKYLEVKKDKLKHEILFEG
jgi:3,4-dihydroxy 2-butanone 4-phosphate synthase/GTP cyclohydrolase II